MASRLNLQAELEEFLGSANVYFQPPESVRLVYPCIVYSRSSGLTQYANDMPYKYAQAYQIEIIDKDPDSELVPRMTMAFPTVRYQRHFTHDNLNHDIFYLYY